MSKNKEDLLEDNFLPESKGLSNIFRTWSPHLHPLDGCIHRQAPITGSQHRAWLSTGLELTGQTVLEAMLEDTPSGKACRGGREARMWSQVKSDLC